MIYNKFKNGIKIVLSALLFFSCSDFLKGKPKEENVIEIKQETVSCLKNVSLNVKKFMRSESVESDIENTFKCFDDTLNEFQNRVEGSVESKSFTSDELYKIFDKFIKSAGVSKAAVDDLLILKAALLGGTSQKISKTEISTLREFLLLIKEEIKNLSPYTRLFAFRKGEVVISKEMINNGFAQLNRSIKNLLKFSRIARSNYQFSDLRNLALNLKIVSDENNYLLILAEKVHVLLVGHQDIANEQDRFLYIDNLTEVLRLYSIQSQGYVKFEVGSVTEMNSTISYIHDLLELLEHTLQYKKTNLISAESLDPLLSEILKRQILPLKLTNDTALSFYKTILVRVFDSGLGGDINAFGGIKKIHFVNLKRELAVYRIFSKFIEEASGNQDLKAQNGVRVPIKDIQARLNIYKFKNSEEILRPFDQNSRDQIMLIVNELKTEYLVKNPVIYRFNKIVLAANQEIWDQNWEDLARGLYFAMISRELILGWGETPQEKEVKKAYISEQGLVQWYSEFKKFGIESGSFDPRSKNSGASNLISANLFTRSGNGDNKLTFREATQFLGLLFSGGGKVYNEMAAGLKKANCNLPEFDIFGNNWNNEACAYVNLRQNYKYYFSNLPYLVMYLDKLNKNDEDFKSFYESLMTVSRVDATSKGRLETADLRTMSTILHYIESIFSAYDLDRNGYLSENEIKAFYPKFRTFAEKFAHKSAGPKLESFNYWRESVLGLNSCFNEQDLIKESFVFMIYNGRSPSMSDLTVFPCLRNEPLIKFNGEIDRKNIINTFKIIKDVLGS